ncbi:MAG: ATP synthase F0 subunit C [Candidatus Caenarcaniphilales bacterium]|nr:ATP synthase F0 subunit C [Candidatus Caenarcaniphilales bacterium]
MSSEIAIGAGLAAMGVLGPALGVGLIGFKALEGMARQPESANRLFIFGLVFAALCEGLGIVAWLVSNNLAARV